VLHPLLPKAVRRLLDEGSFQSQLVGFKIEEALICHFYKTNKQTKNNGKCNYTYTARQNKYNFTQLPLEVETKSTLLSI